MKDFIARPSRERRLRVAGLMSGTSADGVDVAVVDLLGWKVRVRAFDTVPYAPALRRRVLEVSDPAAGRVDEVCWLNVLLGEAFADALRRVARSAGIDLASIDLIGSHGQTIAHLPRDGTFRGRRTGSTLQIGEPCVIAERTGVTTVADFRPRDLAAGGQGAPLVPFADLVMFAHPRRARAVQNIGGIANVTWLPAGAGPAAAEGVLAFDTGPGNMVIDRLAFLATGGRASCDRDGGLAGRGTVNRRLLSELMRHRFLRRRPPKSTGREDFGWAFADDLFRLTGRSASLSDGPARARRAGQLQCPRKAFRGRLDRSRSLDANDLIATVTAFTAQSIADAYRRFLPRRPDEVVLCGGGARNPLLVAMLREALAPAPVVLSDELGVNADAREAVAFALLAAATVRGLPGNVPGATGARRGVVLGKIVPGR